MLIGVIQQPSLAALQAQADCLPPDLYDALELRLDACRDLSLPGLAALRLPLPVIYTLRSSLEGGQFRGSEAERLDWLEKLAALRPDYLDLEAFLDQQVISRIQANHPGLKIILSKHDFEATPRDLQAMLAEMQAKAPLAIHKIACLAGNSLDALRLQLFCREQGQAADKLIGISMGEAGQSSRILAPVLHSGFCYCPLAVDNSSAPGQLMAAELRETYNFSSLNRTTAIYGLLGDPVEQSLGHVLHNQLNRAQSLNAIYPKWRINQAELPEALPLLHQLGVQGLSLTMPLKEAAIPLLSSIDQDAWQIGAVNTLIRTAQGWHGANTDGQGAMAALGFKPAGRHLAVLGAGGAAKAVIHAALQAGARVTVFNRTPDKTLPGKLRPLAFSRLHELRHNPCRAIINALPFDLDFSYSSVPFNPDCLAFDLSYNKQSRFLTVAKKAGCQTMDGLTMFEQQAELQRRLWGLPNQG